MQGLLNVQVLELQREIRAVSPRVYRPTPFQVTANVSLSLALTLL